MPLHPSVPKSASGDGISIENESGQSIAIDDNGASLTIDATSLPLPTGASTETKQDTGNASLASIDTKLTSPLTVTGTVSVNEPVSVDDNGASLTVDGTVTANAGTGTFIVGDGGASISVDDNGGSLTVDGPLTDAQLRAAPVPVTQGPVTTAALTNVPSSATNVTLLASNANRKMAMFYNDSNQDLFLKFGETASLTSFTVRLDPDSYFEMPLPMYTGIIDGIWDSANGAARVTELS